MPTQDLGNASPFSLKALARNISSNWAGMFTSRSEASLNAVLEYMAMGLPAVVSDIPGNRDLLDHVLFELGNARDLAEKVVLLWNQPGLRARAHQQYRRYAMEYSLGALARRAQCYYLTLAAEGVDAKGGGRGPRRRPDS